MQETGLGDLPEVPSTINNFMVGMGKGVENTNYSLEEAVSVALMHCSLIFLKGTHSAYYDIQKQPHLVACQIRAH